MAAGYFTDESMLRRAHAAVDADLTHVVLVAERYRLFHGLVFTVRFGGDATPGEHRGRNDDDGRQHDQLRVETGTRVEYLCHLPRVPAQRIHASGVAVRDS